MERTTRSETFSKTEFDSSLETRCGDRTHSCAVLNSVETIERGRSVEIPPVVFVVVSFVLFSSCVGDTSHVLRRTESGMQFEACPVDVAVRSSTRLPLLVPGETPQNIVDTPTVLE